MRKFIPILLLPFLLIAGCSDRDNSTDTGDNPTPDINQAYEQTQQLTEYYENDNSAGEPVESDITVPDLTDDSYDIYAVTIVWGWPFPEFEPEIEPTVWDGTLSMNAVGVVDINRTIDFETGQDSVLHHSVPSAVSWGSTTDGDFDGICAYVFYKQGIEYFVAPELTFTTGPFTVSWDFGQLEDFTALYQVDDFNLVAVRAKRIWTYPCPRGFLEGTWIKDTTLADSGRFEGVWIEENNDTLGYYTGQFGRREDGTGVFSGSVSGYVTDQVIAEFSGEWMFDDPRMCPMCGEGHGLFWGKYEYLDREGSGTMRGVFGDYSLPPDDIEMPMKGYWRDDCDPVSIGSNTGIE